MTRTRSLWAWGWDDKQPDAAARAGLAQLARALLGGGDFAPRAPATGAAIAVAPSRIAPPAALAALCSAEPTDRAHHAHGKGYPDLVRGFAGDFAAAPDLVARPADAADVARLLDACAEAGWAAVPFGGGTSVVAGVEVPRDRHPGVVSIDLERLGRVEEIDATSRLARIGAGARGPALEDQLAVHGLTLRCYPQSFEHSTLGGWLATRAGGHYATLYTHVDDLCHALTMVTPRGALATRRHPASGAGPEPLRWALGSEGALGVITEAWMRVVPRPRWRASASVKFATWDAGVAAARALAQSGLHPANARLLDAGEARLHRVAFDGTSVLLVGFESADHPLGPWLDRALELARDHGGTVATGPRLSDDGATQRVPATEKAEPPYDGPAREVSASRVGEAASWRQAFLDAPYLQSALVSIGVLADTFETACTWAAFPALDAAVRAAVGGALAQECGGGLVTCRFTHVYPDGPAPYYTFLGAARPGAELAQWRTIKAAACEALAAHGGTITHHHAVGRVHKPWYERERPALFGAALAAVKRELDPAGIMNPGCLVDAPPA
jgi:alkyldihydroxyacetonephosphate synthase